MIDISRRRLLLAISAVPLAVVLPRLPVQTPMSVGDAIAWLHRVGLRFPDSGQ